MKYEDAKITEFCVVKKQNQFQKIILFNTLHQFYYLRMVI